MKLALKILRALIPTLIGIGGLIGIFYNITFGLKFIMAACIILLSFLLGILIHLILEEYV